MSDRQRGDYEQRFEAEIGHAIQRKREALGMDQAELGNRVGVHANTIWRWENGESLSYWMFLRICDALGVQPGGMTPSHATYLGMAIRRMERERDAEATADERRFHHPLPARGLVQ
jgi:transcriptional regulator with XRE-family HTH domain